jgi:hypothetical protein
MPEEPHEKGAEPNQQEALYDSVDIQENMGASPL